MTENLKEKISEEAKILGFSLVNFTSSKVDSKYTKAFNDWLNKKYEAGMAYLEKKEQRENLLELLPRAKSVITLATNYYHEQRPPSLDHGIIARYAYGRDYHKILGKRLKKLESFIQKIAPEAETKSYVDTGPVLERSLAEQSGLGVIGKNSCLITKDFGSWVFLSEIITTLELSPDKPTPNERFSVCGSCRLCMDACPTGAIVAPGVIDSSKCISYLTIENKDEEIPEEFHKIIKKAKRLYGCDICQEVCPHNSRAIPHSDQELKAPSIAGDELGLNKILEMNSDEDFLETFAGSPLMRAKRKGLQRNAGVILGIPRKKEQ